MEKKAKIAVIDYGMGNLRSVLKAWQHSGADAFLVMEPEAVNGADALVFPGQGCVVDTMKLLEQTGFDKTIRDWVEADKPFFGICLGLQALFQHSEEGDTQCLGLFEGEVKRFQLAHEFKIPHMGWNAVSWRNRTPVDEGMDVNSDQYYFVHSFHAVGVKAEEVWGETEYGGKVFCSAIRRGNCYATQFHPEKSQAKGLELYHNFVSKL